MQGDTMVATGTDVGLDGDPLPYSSVVLFDGDQFITGRYTDENGYFSIPYDPSALENSKVRLMVSAVGITKTLYFDSASPIDTNELILEVGKHDLLSVGIIVTEEIEQPLHNAGLEDNTPSPLPDVYNMNDYLRQQYNRENNP